MASIKDNCNGKPHVKVLCSFKASVLKIATEVGQKEVDMSVLMDEFKRLKTAPWPFLLLRKPPNLVDLVTRKRILNFKKDIGSLYVTKDGCREFISPRGEVDVMNVAEVVSKSNFFNILMDGSTIHVKKKEGYTFSRFKVKN